MATPICANLGGCWNTFLLLFGIGGPKPKPEKHHAGIIEPVDKGPMLAARLKNIKLVLGGHVQPMTR